MNKAFYVLTTALLLLTTPALADAGHTHDTMPANVPAHGHGSAEDDHSKIQTLAVTPQEAVTTLETGLAALLEKAGSNEMQEVIKESRALMSAVKTLQEAEPNERQAAALRQLDQQLDAAKHAAEDGDAEKTGSSVVKAQSALKLYKAMKQ